MAKYIEPTVTPETMTEHQRMNFWWRKAKASEAKLQKIEKILETIDSSESELAIKLRTFLESN